MKTLTRLYKIYRQYQDIKTFATKTKSRKSRKSWFYDLRLKFFKLWDNIAKVHFYQRKPLQQSEKPTFTMRRNTYYPSNR